jgi:hypothetical protein
MSNIKDLIVEAGIVGLPNLYNDAEVFAINAAASPPLSKRMTDQRAYIHVDEMVELGLFELLFTERLKDVLFSIMPDAVLYHCHINEIAANDSKSHIFGDRLAGWHRDSDSSYVEGDPTHVSVFVYLTDVGAEDGPFEFIPDEPPPKWLRNRMPFISVQEPSGYSFAWHRSYFHRAAPNRGPVRRRLLKVSIQRNRYSSATLSNSYFRKVMELIPAGDEKIDLLLGRYQGKVAPTLCQPSPPAVASLSRNGSLDLSEIDLTKERLRGKAANLKRRLLRQEVSTAGYGG